jgi:hypothetical protein
MGVACSKRPNVVYSASDGKKIVPVQKNRKIEGFEPLKCADLLCLLRQRRNALLKTEQIELMNTGPMGEEEMIDSIRSMASKRRPQMETLWEGYLLLCVWIRSGQASPSSASSVFVELFGPIISHMLDSVINEKRSSCVVLSIEGERLAIQFGSTGESTGREEINKGSIKEVAFSDLRGGFLVPFDMLNDESLVTVSKDWSEYFIRDYRAMASQSQLVAVDLIAFQSASLTFVIEEEVQALQRSQMILSNLHDKQDLTLSELRTAREPQRDLGDMLGEPLGEASNVLDFEAKSCNQLLCFSEASPTGRLYIALPSVGRDWRVTLSVLNTGCQKEEAQFYKEPKELTGQKEPKELIGQKEPKELIPLFSFRMRIPGSTSLPICHFEPFRFVDDFRIIAPLNGILPIGERVVFKVDIKDCLRLFFVQHACKVAAKNQPALLLDHKTELWLNGLGDHNANRFERAVKIESRNGTLIAQKKHTFRYVILARFKAVEPKKDEFQRINNRLWLDLNPAASPQLTHYPNQGSFPEKLKNGDAASRIKAYFEVVEVSLIQAVSVVSLMDSIQKQRCSDCDRMGSKEGKNKAQPINRCMSCLFMSIAATFKWVCTAVKYKKTEPQPSDVPDVVIQTQGAVCRGFSSLFLACMETLGIRCLLVDGFVHSTVSEEEPAKKAAKANHQWNLFQVCGEWMICDPTFASFYTKTPEQTVYLCPEPEVLAMSHYPEEPCYSLLKRYSFELEGFANSVGVSPRGYRRDQVLNVAVSREESCTVLRMLCLSPPCEFSVTLNTRGGLDTSSCITVLSSGQKYSGDKHPWLWDVQAHTNHSKGSLFLFTLSVYYRKPIDSHILSVQLSTPEPPEAHPLLTVHQLTSSRSLTTEVFEPCSITRKGATRCGVLFPLIDTIVEDKEQKFLLYWPLKEYPFVSSDVRMACQPEFTRLEQLVLCRLKGARGTVVIESREGFVVRYRAVQEGMVSRNAAQYLSNTI